MTQFSHIGKNLIVEGIADAMSPDSAFVPAPGNGVSSKTVSQAFTDLLKYADDKAGTNKSATISFDEYRRLVGVPEDLPSDRDEDAQAFYEAVNLRLCEFAERNGMKFVNYGGGDGIEVIFTTSGEDGEE